MQAICRISAIAAVFVALAGVSTPAFAERGRDIVKGSADQTTYIRIIDSLDGTPETGVTSATGGLDLEYVRLGAAPADLTESDLAATDSAHSDGGMIHVGGGIYRVDVPDAAAATGVNDFSVQGTVTGMVVLGVTHQLTDFSPYVAVPPVNATQIEGGDATDALATGAETGADASLATYDGPTNAEMEARTPSATAIGNIEIVYNTDFAANYDATNDNWITKLDPAQGAVAFTGHVSISDGLAIAASTSNRTAFVATGNGTGHGAQFASGSGATGNGIYAFSGGTNGNGASFTGAGSQNGLSVEGGATGNGLFARGGETSGYGGYFYGESDHAFVVTSDGTNKDGVLATGGGGTGIDIRGMLSELGPDSVDASALATDAVDEMQANFALNGVTLTAGGLAAVNTEADTALADYGALKPEIPGRTAAIDVDGAIEADLTKVINTALTQTSAGRLAGNMSVFWNNDDALTVNVVDDVGGVGTGNDWTATDRNQIRHRLGIDGTSSAPSASPSLLSKSYFDTTVAASPDFDTLWDGSTAEAQVLAAGNSQVRSEGTVTVTSQTAFVLSDGPAVDNWGVGYTLVIDDVSSPGMSDSATITAYDGDNQTATIAAGMLFTVITTDTYRVMLPTGGEATVDEGVIASAVRTELATELARIDAAVSTRASQTSVDDVPTAAEAAAAVAAQADIAAGLVRIALGVPAAAPGSGAGAATAQNVDAIEAEAAGILTDVDQEPVGSGCLILLVQKSGLGLVGEASEDLVVGQDAVTYAVDFRNDTAANKGILSVDDPTIISGTAGGLAFVKGRDKTQAKLRISASVAGAYTVGVKVTYQGGGTRQGRFTINAIQ